MRWWLIGGALVLAAGGTVVLERAGITGYAATRALRAAGFPDGDVTVRRLDLDGLEASLNLGDAGGVESAVLGWSATGLMAGRLDHAALRGATLRLRLTDDGALALPGRPSGTNGGGTATEGPANLPGIPVDHLSIEDARVTVDTAGGSLSQPFRLTGGRTDGGFDARLELPAVEQDLALLAAVTGGSAAGRLSLAGVVALRSDDRALRATPDGCLTLLAKGLAVAGQGIALPDGLCLRAADDGGPLAVWTPGTADPVALRALVSAARLSVPAVKLEVADAAVTLAGGGARAEAMATATVRHTARPAAVAPLSVTAKASWASGAPVTFTTTATGPLRIEAEGSHDPGTGKGRADLRLPKLAFGKDGGALAKAFPMLAGTVAATAGGVAAKGRIAWGEGAPTSSGEILLDGVAAAVGPVSVAGVNGTVRLASLLPPVAPAGQTVAVKLLDVGIPLTDGTLRFGYGRDGRVSVERAEWRWAGGVLRARPFALSPQAPKGLVELEAEGIDFAQLLALAAVDGLDATGRLRGHLPVRIDGGAVSIDGGVLEASAPGAVRYDPAEPPSFLEGEPGSATDLLRGALTDFRYKELRITVNGTAGGELAVGLTLQGANPDFYDGHPVKLNLNLSGALDRILRQSIDAYRIPDAVRERMTEFGQKPP